MNNLVGNRIGKYELIRLLGRGGMAEVYEAFQPGTERSVAIKVLQGYGNQTEESVARFKREARSIAQLRHTNIVQVFDFDIDHDVYYMVMEYIRGGTLSQLIHDSGMLSVADAVRIMIQLTDALAYAHEHGVIHRDLKPVNIMFTDLAHKHPVVTDFGIARILGDPALTADGRFMGSPAYISPEVVRGLGADARSDIYGLGLVFYEMLTGRRPYHADNTGDVVVQHLSAPLPPPSMYNPAISHSVELVVSKALAKDRERRYQSAAEFKQSLMRTLEKLEGQPSPTPRPHGVSTTVPVEPPVFSTAPVSGADTTTLPFDDVVFDSKTRTLPFDESVPITTQVAAEPQRRRRRPILMFILILALAGGGLYLVSTQNQAVAGDEPTATVTVGASGTIVPEVIAATGTLTPTETPSPTWTPTATDTSAPTATLEVPREKENSLGVKPTSAPTDTPTVTPQATNTSRPRPTQPPANTSPTNAPVQQPTTDPGSGGGGGSSGGGSTDGGSSNPVQDTVDDVADTVGGVINQIIPTLCILNCH